MKLQVKRSKVNGEVTVPGSKSHTIRAVAVATVAKGLSYIKNPLISGDTISCLNAAKALGAEVTMEEDLWIIKGASGKISLPTKGIDVGNSGTTLRIFTGLAATAGFPVSFDGDSSLRNRPMSNLLDSLESLGVNIDSNNGKCPLTVNGPIKGGHCEIEGSSSQFLTALLFAAPLAVKDTFIKVNNLNEVPYIEMTLDWLDKQKIQYSHNDDMSEFIIKAGQHYSNFDLIIPADFSTATFPLVAAAITKGKVKIKNLDFEDRQGDKVVFKYLEQMGMTVNRTSKYTEVSITGELHGAELDLNATPDALPAMAIAASFAKGKTILGNVPQARIKETDRIDCMTKELRKIGIKVEELEDGMIIEGGIVKGAEVESYDDHRIAMAMTIAGLASKGNMIVRGADAASVTYPNFVDDFKSLGADINIIS